MVLAMLSGSYGPPRLRDQVIATLLAALCSILFLGKGLDPGCALLPFPPETIQPWADAAAGAASRPGTAADLLVGNSSMGDKYGQSLAWDRITMDALREGRLPLWSREIGGGVPFVPQMAQVYQPWNLLLLVVPALSAYGIWFLLHQTLFGLFAYRFVRLLGVSHAAGLVALVAIVLGTWMQARIHHNVIVTAALPLFPMLSRVHALTQGRPGWRDAGLLGLFAGLAWLSSFPAVALQACGLVAVYALVRTLALPGGERRRALVRVGTGFALGALLASAQLVPMALAASETSRGLAPRAELLDFLRERALRPAHLLQGLWPDLLHWPRDHFLGAIDTVHPSWAALWLVPGVIRQAQNFPETAWAIGIAPLALALLGLLARPRRDALMFGAASVLGFAIALAAPLVFDVAALLRVERLAGDLRRFLFLPAMALPVLAALGTERWLRGGAGKLVPSLLAALVVASLALVVVQGRDLAAFQNAWAERLAPIHGATVQLFHETVARFPTEPAANLERLTVTLLRAALVGGVTLFALLAHRPRASTVLLLAVTAGELWHAGRGTIVAVEHGRLALPPLLAPVRDAQLRAPHEPWRIHRICGPAERLLRPLLLPPNLGAYLGFEDLAAYSPQPSRRMEELFLAAEPDAPGKLSVAARGAGVDMLRDPATLTHPLLDLLGCRFVLAGAALPDLPSTLRDVTPEGHRGACRLYERTSVLPWATFLTKARIAEKPAERLRLLGDRAHDPAREIVLEDRSAPLPIAERAARFAVVRQEIAAERVILRVRTEAPGWLRIADPFDPGWRASVDGKPATIHRADHYLRAVWLAPGEHTVEMRFDAPLVKLPRHLSLLALLLCALAVLRGRRSSA